HASPVRADLDPAPAAATRRVAPGGCPPGAPSEPCVPLVAAHGSSKPRGRRRVRCWFPALAGWEPALAGWVHEAELVTCGRAGPPLVDEVAGGYRLAGDLQPPPFPLLGGLGWLIRCEQVFPAERAPCVLPGQQAQGVVVRRGFDLLAPGGPVRGQGRVIGGCPALDRHVPLDASPGELDQVAAAVAVAEHPPVVPELVELAEVPGDDPAPRLVPVAPSGPLVEQPPQVAVQQAEHPG